jgi:ABC-type uncharacterized transport system fused permease/ATPase subunit
MWGGDPAVRDPGGIMMTASHHFFRECLALSKPYFLSDERVGAWTRLLGIVGLNLFQVYLLVWLNGWRGVFFDALQNYDLQVCMHQLLLFFRLGLDLYLCVAPESVLASIVADTLAALADLALS